MPRLSILTRVKTTQFNGDHKQGLCISDKETASILGFIVLNKEHGLSPILIKGLNAHKLSIKRL